MTHVVFTDVEDVRIVVPKDRVILEKLPNINNVIVTGLSSHSVSNETFSRIERELLEPNNPLNGTITEQLSVL